MHRLCLEGNHRHPHQNRTNPTTFTEPPKNHTSRLVPFHQLSPPPVEADLSTILADYEDNNSTLCTSRFVAGFGVVSWCLPVDGVLWLLVHGISPRSLEFSSHCQRGEWKEVCFELVLRNVLKFISDCKDLFEEKSYYFLK